ncbi:Uncharacterised protein [Enterobacter hormaechei]|nr:Uncharacterised protein [Enterobacter hormaechei]
MPQVIIGLASITLGLVAIAISARSIYEMWCFLREQKNK